MSSQQQFIIQIILSYKFYHQVFTKFSPKYLHDPFSILLHFCSEKGKEEMESLMTTRRRRPRTNKQDGELIMKCITKYVTITSLEYSLV